MPRGGDWEVCPIGSIWVRLWFHQSGSFPQHFFSILYRIDLGGTAQLCCELPWSHFIFRRYVALRLSCHFVFALLSPVLAVTTV